MKDQTGPSSSNGNKILAAYFKGWFWLDLVASFPFQIFDLMGTEGTSDQLNIMRKLARLPRLARLFRVLRILKLIKMLKNNRTIQNFLERLSMNPGIMRLISTVIIVAVIVHVYS